MTLDNANILHIFLKKIRNNSNILKISTIKKWWIFERVCLPWTLHSEYMYENVTWYHIHMHSFHVSIKTCPGFSWYLVPFLQLQYSWKLYGPVTDCDFEDLNIDLEISVLGQIPGPIHNLGTRMQLLWTSTGCFSIAPLLLAMLTISCSGSSLSSIRHWTLLSIWSKHSVNSLF